MMTGLRLRFRSVLMTALSFVIVVLPFLFATGAGAAARRWIGIVTFWGMLAATFAGILFVPMLHVILTGSEGYLTQSARRTRKWG